VFLRARLVVADGEARRGDAGKCAFDGGQHGVSTRGADGLPAIAYHDKTQGDLKVVKCSSPTCMPFVRSR
jgi:hypothetical protein